MTRIPLLLMGAGGHAASCIDVIEAHGGFVVTCLTGLADEVGSQCLGYTVAGTYAALPALRAQASHGLVGIGQIANPGPRIGAFDALVAAGYTLPVMISPRAHVSPHATIGRGTIVMHGATVNARAVIGDNCIVNSHALVEHDARVGDHCHISTGAVLNGGVVIGARAFVGSRAVIREGRILGDACLVGLGAVVRHAHPAGARIWGPDA